MQAAFSSHYMARPVVYFVVASLIMLLTAMSFPLFADELPDIPLYEEKGWLATLRSAVIDPLALMLSMLVIAITGGMLILVDELSILGRTLIFIILVAALLVGAENMIDLLFGPG